MAAIRFFDGADELRIEIVGRFSGECVNDVATAWREALGEVFPRRCTIDISQLAGYDTAGRKLLSEMCRHGMNFAAGTPQSLVFLSEISNFRRGNGPKLVEAPAEQGRPVGTEAKVTPIRRFRAAAAGE